MLEWYNAMEPFFQGVAVVAICATLIMLIQLIMLIIGFGSDHDFDGDGDFDSDGDIYNDGTFADVFGLKILSIRNFFIFLAMGGWSMIIIYELSENYPIAIIFGIIVGLIMVVLCSYAMKKAMQLQDSGNIDIANSIGKIGTVYLKIPGKRAGMGKVNVLIQERFVELDAMSEDEEDIPTGSEVLIVSQNNDYVVVKKN